MGLTADSAAQTSEPRTRTGRKLLAGLIEHVASLSPKDAEAMHSAATAAILAIEAEAAHDAGLDVERLARALREIFASLEYQRWHEPRVPTWDAAAKKIAAAYAEGEQE